MSVTFIDALETLHSRHCPPSCECSIKDRPVTPADLHDYKSQLKAIVLGNEESDNGWHDCFCVDCERCETFHGAVDDFVDELLKLGWSVESEARGTAICLKCANYEPTLTEQEIWEDQAVYTARGK